MGSPLECPVPPLDPAFMRQELLRLQPAVRVPVEGAWGKTHPSSPENWPPGNRPAKEEKTDQTTKQLSKPQRKEPLPPRSLLRPRLGCQTRPFAGSSEGPLSSPKPQKGSGPHRGRQYLPTRERFVANRPQYENVFNAINN